MTQPSDVWEAGDAARALGVDVDVLHRLAARGDLHPVPGSWPLRIRRSELEGVPCPPASAPGGGRSRRRRSGALALASLRLAPHQPGSGSTPRASRTRAASASSPLKSP